MYKRFTATAAKSNDNVTGGLMGKLILGTFLILGFAFYELSGGADFVPESRTDQLADAEIVQETPKQDVTRSNSATLINVAAEAPVQEEAQVIQAVAEAAELDVVAQQPAVVVIEPPAAPDLRVVAGTRVNMRTGPGTDYSVLDTLPSGTTTEVIEVNAAGWARVRVTDTGQIGWMAERLLTQG